MLAGFAEVDWTPEPGLYLFGQMHKRRAEHARDPLTASAIAVSDGDPGPPVVLASVDVCVLDARFVAEAQAEFQRRTGLAGGRLLLHATHTHVAPSTVSIMAGQADPSLLQHLRTAIVSAAEMALADMRPCTMVGGTGRLEALGWNRRGMFADGTSRMYGHAGMPGFVGPEGPRDPSLPVLAFRGSSGAIRGVVLGFSTHPNCLEDKRFYSADLPGEVRRQLRALLGAVGVVYLTGAAGNTAPSILELGDAEQPWRGEAGLLRSGQYLASQAAAVLAAARPLGNGPVALLQSTLSIPPRRWPAPTDPNYPEPLTTAAWPEARAYYEASEREWPQRVAAGPVEVRLNVLRLGDAAVCTSPAELFVEFGLAIRRASPASITLIAELTDGYVGYVPTQLAFSHGGYETWPAPSSFLAPEAGDAIVLQTQRMLWHLFQPSGAPFAG